jgi:hypothetical protein
LTLLLCSCKQAPPSSTAKGKLSLEITHSLEIPNQSIAIHISGNELTVTRQNRDGKRTVTSKELTDEELESLWVSVDAVDWRSVTKDDVLGLDGTTYRIQFGVQDLRVWSPEDDTEERKLTELMTIKTLLCSHADNAQEQQPPAFMEELLAFQIPIVNAKDTSLEELIDFISQRLKGIERNTPDGISFFTHGFDKTNDSKTNELENKASYSRENVRLDEMIADIALLYQVDFHVTSVGIVVTPHDAKPFPNPKAEKGEIYATYTNKSGKKPNSKKPTPPSLQQE